MAQIRPARYPRCTIILTIKPSIFVIRKQTLIRFSRRIMTSRKIILVSWIALLAIGISSTEAAGRYKRLLRNTIARPGDLKYQVALKVNGYHECGGALISNSHVLTAAHCFRKIGPPYTEGLVLITGMTRYSIGGEEHRPKRVTLHPGYVSGDSGNRWRHDIAVVTLYSPAVTSPLQAPIALPTGNLTGNVTGLVSGWGQMAKGIDGQYPDELRKSPVTIITLEDCRSRNNALESQICGFDGAGTGFCNGDSGGPLVYNNEVVGVVSFGVSCGIGYPDIYTRVYAYLDFIRQAMQRA